MPRPELKCDMPGIAGLLTLAVLVAVAIVGVVEILGRLAGWLA